MALALLCDEHIPYPVVEGLRRRGIDVVTIQEMELRSARDDTVLAAAREHGRVVYTSDVDLLRLHAAGIHHTGILYHHLQAYSVREAIHQVGLACEVLSPDEMRDRVEFV